MSNHNIYDESMQDVRVSFQFPNPSFISCI